MEHNKIDIQIAQLVVQIYVVLNAIKGKLNKTPFSETKDLLKKRNLISEMMNNIVNEKSPQNTALQINQLSTLISSLMIDIQHFENTPEGFEIKQLFKILNTHIALMQAKLNV